MYKMQLLPLRRRDALHDLGHGLPLLPDGGPLRKFGGNLPLVFHEEHEGLGEVLACGGGGIGRDAPSVPVVWICSPSRTLSVGAAERQVEEIAFSQGLGIAMRQRMPKLVPHHIKRRILVIPSEVQGQAIVYSWEMDVSVIEIVEPHPADKPTPLKWLVDTFNRIKL